MQTASGDHTPLCWRAWPCRRCRQGLSPLGFLRGRLPAGPALPRLDAEQAIDRQRADLLAWVAACPHQPGTTFRGRLLGVGSEHRVLHDAAENLAVKSTLPGTFGDYYFLRDGRVCQEKSTPLEYLLRMHLWGTLFGVAPKPVGLTPSGEIITRQPFILGEVPSQAAVDHWLAENGLHPVRPSCWLWAHRATSLEVWIGDARADNFVQTEQGIIPIDLRVWIPSPA